MSAIVEIDHLSHIYAKGSPYETKALNDISLSIEQGEFLGLFGPNGSGKSTLVQHFNGLIRPQNGSVTVCGLNVSKPGLNKDLWQLAGLVFQFPEHQIFQTSVYDEVAYGPRNLKLTEANVKERVYDALQQVGLEQENITRLPPVTLSGGMRRRVAIAGILAIRPQILILDEPMAGLDSNGRKLILEIIKKRQEKRETTVMISHNLKEIMALTDKIAILAQGSLLFCGEVKELLNKPEILAQYHFELPEYLQVIRDLIAHGLAVQTNISCLREAGGQIVRLLEESKRQKANSALKQIK